MNVISPKWGDEQVQKERDATQERYRDMERYASGADLTPERRAEIRRATPIQIWFELEARRYRLMVGIKRDGLMYRAGLAQRGRLARQDKMRQVK